MASDAPPPAQMNWLEQQFANTNIVILVIFGLCCGGLAAILAAITYFTGTDPKAKQNALIVMIIGAIMFFVYGGGFCCSGGYNYKPQGSLPPGLTPQATLVQVATEDFNRTPI